jgi:hypothetical protein
MVSNKTSETGVKEVYHESNVKDVSENYRAASAVLRTLMGPRMVPFQSLSVMSSESANP